MEAQMSGRNEIVEECQQPAFRDEGTGEHGNELMRQLIRQPTQPSWQGSFVTVGELVAVAEDGSVVLVINPARTDLGVLRARSVVDLHAAHIGADVLLAFEQGDASRPVVMGVLRGQARWPLEEAPGHVEVSVNGERLVVSARRQLVLRCGKASITLTSAGKVLIEGAHVVSRSTGMNRIKGGSIQLN
jgi:Domain of unknown function (DUF6484)